MLDLLAGALLGVVFAGAVVGKVRSASAFADFRDSMVALAPRRLPGRPLAVAVVAGEAAVVLLLAAPAARLAGYALSVLLLGAFCAGIARAVHSRQRIRCRCFGAGGGVLGAAHLVRNGLLIVVAAAGAFGGGGASAPEALVALTTGALLGLAIVRWEDIAFLLGRSVPTGRH